jgi:hypothetical protein
MEDRDEREREGKRQRSAPRKEKKASAPEEEAAHPRLICPAAAHHPRGSRRRFSRCPPDLRVLPKGEETHTARGREGAHCLIERKPRPL